MRVSKLHGCGNDYIYVDQWREQLPHDLAELSRAVSDRHCGIGSDGLIVVGPSAYADLRMDMYNADGSSSGMCGNGIRCAVKFAYDHGHLNVPTATVETGAGLRTVYGQLDEHGRFVGARVAMGAPLLDAASIPVAVSDQHSPICVSPDIDGANWTLICIGMGNPHAVCFVDDAETAPVTTIGPLLERHSLFPERANIEFVSRLPDEDGIPVLRQRTWERGSGETQACGTGASAVMVAARLTGAITGNQTRIRLNGGDLLIQWDGHAEVFMTGEAVHVCDADWPDSH